MRAQPQLVQQLALPAPSGGINAVDGALTMAPTDALALVNLISGRLGVTTRLGYQLHAAELGAEVRTIIPFTGGLPAADLLFAATTAGLYDVTGIPVQVLEFGTADDDSGWGVTTGITTNGGSFLFYADETNGLFRFDGSDWEAVTDITFSDGTTAADIVFVTVWKNRLWLVKRGTGDAYFLDVGSIAGAASRQSFGNKFRAGGQLIGLWNWTRDGGNGVDDHLVAISSAGDVLVYAGSDPASASAFNLIGSWYIGAVPAGRRIATDFGGDLLVLSLLGVVPLSRIISGTFEVSQAAYTTQKIQPLFNRYAAERKDLRGWSLRISPEDNALLVNMPVLGSRYEQFAMSLANGSWSLLTGVPSLSSEVWRGQLYFGTTDGRVCLVTGDEDDGAAIEWSGQTSFQGGAAPSRKRIQMIQPLLVYAGARPGIEVQARYDFATDPISRVPPSPDSGALATWNVAVWDAALWPGVDVTLAPWRGAVGNGLYAGIAFRGRSGGKTTLLGFNVRLDVGGVQ